MVQHGNVMLSGRSHLHETTCGTTFHVTYCKTISIRCLGIDKPVETESTLEVIEPGGKQNTE